jgi:glutamate carboxypeptidase
VVPETCTLDVDLRSPELATLQEAEREIERVCSEPFIPDVRAEIARTTWHRPMEKRENSARLVDLAVTIAAELGFELKDAATGGASDANTTSAAGTPTIDGLGPVGGDDHGPAEWLDLSSVVPRVALLAGLIARA